MRRRNAAQISRPITTRGNPVHRIVSTYNYGQININNTLGAMFFDLHGFTIDAAVTTLFDQYMIEEIEVMFDDLYPVNQTYWNGSAAVQDAKSSLWVAIDYNDVNTPSNEAAVLSHENARMLGSKKLTTIRLVPHVAVALYQASSFTAYGNKARQWIDTGYDTVQHYGLKYAITEGTNSPGANWGYNVYVKARFAFRCVI